MISEEQRAVEILITMAQINLLSEQIEMVKGGFRHKLKQDFNTALNKLDKGLEKLKDKLSEDQILMFENMTDVYHAQSDSIRKQILKDATK